MRTSDKRIQIFVSDSMKQPILYINHYSLLADRSRGRKLQFKIRKDFYCPSLAVDCYENVRKFQNSAEKRSKLRKNLTRLQHFPAKESLTSVCVHILSPFIHRSRKNEQLLLVTIRFSNMTKTKPIKGISSTKVSKHFANSCVFNYDSPEEVVHDNGGCFTSNFF